MCLRATLWPARPPQIAFEKHKKKRKARAFTTSDEIRFASIENHKPSNLFRLNEKKRGVCFYCFYNLEKVPGS